MGNLMDSMSLKPKEEERARVWRRGVGALRKCGLSALAPTRQSATAVPVRGLSRSRLAKMKKKV